MFMIGQDSTERLIQLSAICLSVQLTSCLDIIIVGKLVPGTVQQYNCYCLTHSWNRLSLLVIIRVQFALLLMVGGGTAVSDSYMVFVSHNSYGTLLVP